LQIIGRPFEEDLILRLGAALEDALPPPRLH
jgi:Asp-tRNA(Asn)/Glu-tRNA(Gln) amidotransferase A subunit family amidase